MSNVSEIDELIDVIHRICPEILASQLTSFGEEPFESGVWRLQQRDNEDVYINIEVHRGTIYALYSNKEFSNKYPINAEKICEFFNKFNRSQSENKF